MNKKYIILLSIAALTLAVSGCESCKGLSGANNSPASALVQKHIEYLKISTKEAYSAESKSPEELETILANIEKVGKDIKSTYIVKIKNSCSAEEISSTDKLLTCVNDALEEGMKTKVEDADNFMYEKCKGFESPKSTECSQVVSEFFEEFDKAKK